MADALDKAVRQARRTTRIPKAARCTDCGITAPVLLHPHEDAWRCYECANIRRDLCRDETHHLLGKDIDPMTVDLPANLHRILSEEQLDIPDEIRGLSPHDPLVWIIRVLCAIRDFGRAILDMLERSIAWLTRLLLALVRRFGARWADALDLPPLFG
jgi:hypothetical protein